jgi:2-oxoglutarate dehydrogenase E1 component
MSDIVGLIAPEQGPSWARPNWPLAELDEINIGLDPTQATIDAVKKAAAKDAAVTTADPDAIRRAAEDSLRAMMLIRT